MFVPLRALASLLGGEVRVLRLDGPLHAFLAPARPSAPVPLTPGARDEGFLSYGWRKRKS